MDRFYEALHIDVFKAIIPPPNRHNQDFVEQNMTMAIGDISDADFIDPDDPALYTEVQQLIEKHGEDKCILAHVWGVLEGAYSFMGVEETLLQLGMWKPEMQALVRKLRDWSTRVAENAVDLGIDVLHISSDAGSNGTMMVNPESWRERIAPADEQIISPGQLMIGTNRRTARGRYYIECSI